MSIKRVWLQLLAWGLCVSLAIAFFFRVRDDQRKNEERIRQLQMEASESELIDEEKLESLTDIYDTFYSQLNLQSYVCWGDSAMAGSKENSLPVSLNKVIDDNLFLPLNKSFSKVLEKGEYNIPSVTLINMGVSNENLRQILVRAGVNSLEVGSWIIIPADSDPVTVRLMDEEAWNSDKKDDESQFAKQRNVSFGKVWISDIEGTLITTDDWFDSTHPRYAFVRDEEGNRKSVGSGTEVEIESASMYIGDIPIFFFENDTGRSVDGFVSDVEKLVEHYTNLEEDEADQSLSIPYVVIFTTNEGSEMDKAMSDAFGSRYIRNEYLSSEMTDRQYIKLARQVYDNLDAQGCFDEVKGKIAVAIEEAEEL